MRADEAVEPVAKDAAPATPQNAVLFSPELLKSKFKCFER